MRLTNNKQAFILKKALMKRGFEAMGLIEQLGLSMLSLRRPDTLMGLGDLATSAVGRIKRTPEPSPELDPLAQELSDVLSEVVTAPYEGSAEEIRAVPNLLDLTSRVAFFGRYGQLSELEDTLLTDALIVSSRFVGVYDVSQCVGDPGLAGLLMDAIADVIPSRDIRTPVPIEF